MREDFFQALAHPCRREIIQLLKWQNLSAGEIAEKFSISQPSVSRHLDVLNLSVMQEMYIQLTDLLTRGEEKAYECP